MTREDHNFTRVPQLSLDLGRAATAARRPSLAVLAARYPHLMAGARHAEADESRPTLGPPTLDETGNTSQ